MGDLNEEPGGPTWARLTSGLVDAVAAPRPTFTARRPRRRLDAVLVSPGLRVTGSAVRRDDVTRRASDHLPVVVDLALDDADDAGEGAGGIGAGGIGAGGTGAGGTGAGG
jgi:endonuclease/exonuclease/phosphatase family metal-dependent hydrolase